MGLAAIHSQARQPSRYRLVAVLVICFWLPGSALLANDLAPESTHSLPVLAPGPESDFLASLPTVSEDELSDIRGGEATAVSIQDLDASVTGNSISGTLTTGSVSIGENAFSDLDGISSVVVNSGNNVSIQSSTVINVVIGD